MASKRPRGLDLGLDADAGSGPSTMTASPTPAKKKKLYCHFKTLWKTDINGSSGGNAVVHLGVLLSQLFSTP